MSNDPNYIKLSGTHDIPRCTILSAWCYGSGITVFGAAEDASGRLFKNRITLSLYNPAENKRVTIGFQRWDIIMLMSALGTMIEEKDEEVLREIGKVQDRILKSRNREYRRCEYCDYPMDVTDRNKNKRIHSRCSKLKWSRKQSIFSDYAVNAKRGDNE